MSDTNLIDFMKCQIATLKAQIASMAQGTETIVTPTVTTPTTKPAPAHWARTLRQPVHQVIGLLVR